MLIAQKQQSMLRQQYNHRRAHGKRTRFIYGSGVRIILAKMMLGARILDDLILTTFRRILFSRTASQFKGGAVKNFFYILKLINIITARH